MDTSALTLPNDDIDSWYVFLLQTTAFFDISVHDGSVLRSVNTSIDVQDPYLPQPNEKGKGRSDDVQDNAEDESMTIFDFEDGIHQWHLPTDLNELYSTIVRQCPELTVPYLHVDSPSFSPALVNFDNIGIVYEYTTAHGKGPIGEDLPAETYKYKPHPRFFFVVFEMTHPQTGKLAPCLQWVEEDRIGPYLGREWGALPTIPVGRGGWGADVDAVHSSSWHVHSSRLQRCRHSCLLAGMEVEVMAQMEQTNGTTVSDKQYSITLGTQLTKTIERIYKRRIQRDWEASKATAAFMEEFMELEE